MTGSNHGKITWKLLKPILQGKILYGPVNNETNQIVAFANKTFEDMARLRKFAGALETSVKMLKTDKEFRKNFDNLLNLAKSPFIQAVLGGSIDIETIEQVLDSIINDPEIIKIVEIAGKILDCFSNDRFVPVNDEKELEDVAHELAKKKLLYAGIYFTSTGNETSYKLRMEVDNTPVTIENRNRFWFPGAEGNFELEMRYHRGFIEIQNSVETAIIKYHKKKQFDANKKSDGNDDLDFSDLDFDDDKTDDKDGFDFDFGGNDDKTDKEENDFGGLKLDNNGDFEDDNASTTTAPTTSTTQAPEINFADVFKSFGNKLNISAGDVNKNSGEDDFWSFDDEETASPTESPVTESSAESTSTLATSRKKRQLDSILSMFGFGDDSSKPKSNQVKYEVDDMTFVTKQIPYPKHTRDDFKKGLYLAQAIQMSFFFALIIHISSSVRQKIWFKESGNLSVSQLLNSFIEAFFLVNS